MLFQRPFTISTAQKNEALYGFCEEVLSVKASSLSLQKGINAPNLQGFPETIFPRSRIKVLVTAKFSKGKLFPHKISALLARRTLVPNTVLDYFARDEPQN